MTLQPVALKSQIRSIYYTVSEPILSLLQYREALRRPFPIMGLLAAYSWTRIFPSNALPSPISRYPCRFCINPSASEATLLLHCHWVQFDLVLFLGDHDKAEGNYFGQISSSNSMYVRRGSAARHRRSVGSPSSTAGKSTARSVQARTRPLLPAFQYQRFLLYRLNGELYNYKR
jgi:hypothetical protein